MWKGGVWASQKGINSVGPWKGSLWRSERSLTSLGIKKLLFGQGQQGVMYVPQPIVDGQQVLFQDSAGTTPVTADGDPVGYMQDLSGNNNHAKQATSAARPIYRTDGVLHWLQFDGVDDCLEGNSVSTSTHSMQVAVSDNSFSSSVIWNNNYGLRIRSLSDGSIYLTYAGIEDIIANFIYNLGENIVITSTAMSDGSVNIRSNSVSLKDDNINYSSGENSGFIIGRNPFSQFLDGNIYGVIALQDVPSSPLAAEKYLAKLAGITL